MVGAGTEWGRVRLSGSGTRLVLFSDSVSVSGVGGRFRRRSRYHATSARTTRPAVAAAEPARTARETAGGVELSEVMAGEAVTAPSVAVASSVEPEARCPESVERGMEPRERVRDEVLDVAVVDVDEVDKVDEVDGVSGIDVATLPSMLHVGTVEFEVPTRAADEVLAPSPTVTVAACSPPSSP